MVICLLWEDATRNKISITALAHVIPDLVLWIDWAKRERIGILLESNCWWNWDPELSMVRISLGSKI
ncbi:hypothetical protein K0M31_001946 [Melipona bicolor]|uniref:Uncharacterized protein n=1 Tax=Melipona bicolor TaxID=60889 RepID=A0AA40KYD0_9HYME|nr:hypothetical protein K0M31_001946 [Melipona bicolor]